MYEIKTYADITKAANAMQKERESKLDQYSMLPDPVQFERVFQEIFAGDEGHERTKHKTLTDIHAYHGVSIHDF